MYVNADGYLKVATNLGFLSGHFQYQDFSPDFQHRWHHKSHHLDLVSRFMQVSLLFGMLTIPRTVSASLDLSYLGDTRQLNTLTPTSRIRFLVQQGMDMA